MKLEGRWTVESLAIGGELQPTLDGPTLTLEVEGMVVSGHTGVNTFTGRLDVEKLFGPLAITRTSGPHELMAQEEIYLRHLRDADGFESSDGGISLLANGLMTLTLLPAEPGPGTNASRETL